MSSKLFACHRGNGLWWVRVFGYGLHGKRLVDHPLLFSERYGFGLAVTFRGWLFKFLTPRTWIDGPRLRETIEGIARRPIRAGELVSASDFTPMQKGSP